MLWLTGNLGVTIATGYSAWADQSGAGVYTSATQATAGKQPLSSTLNGVQCPIGATGAGLDLGTTNPTAGSNLSLFAVFNSTSMARFESLFSRYYNSASWAFGAAVSASSAGKFGFAVNGVEAISNSTVNDGLTHTAVGTYDGTTVKLYIDGTLQTSQPTTTGALATTSDHVGVGCEMDNTNTPFGFVGKFADIAAWTSVRSLSDVGSLRTYAQSKWAAQ